MFLIIFLIIFLTILFSKEKIQEIFGFILCMSVVIFGSVFYYKITFDKEDLNKLWAANKAPWNIWNHFANK